jgi:hypothetical protein
MRSNDVTSSAKIASFGERVERTPFSHRFWRSWPVIGCLGRPKGGDKWGNVRMTGSPASTYPLKIAISVHIFRVDPESVHRFDDHDRCQIFAATCWAPRAAFARRPTAHQLVQDPEQQSVAR